MLVLATLGLLTAGCRMRSRVATTDNDAGVTIKVVNQNRLDVVIYVLHDAYRERLGQVTAFSETAFDFRFRNLGAGHEFELLADPVGSPSPVRTGTVHVLDGQLLTWTLESDFARSHVQIF